MAKSQPDLDYAVLVTECDGRFELCIRELLLFVNADDLREGHERLQGRKLEMVELARTMGLFHELPEPLAPPSIRPILRKSAGMLEPPPGSRKVID